MSQVGPDLFLYFLYIFRTLTIFWNREPYKALDNFFEVVHGLGCEEFLMKLLKVDVTGTPLEILYYLKVSYASIKVACLFC